MMLTRILNELKSHAPFTALGALGGMFFLWVFQDLSHAHEYRFFYLLHSSHVFISALVTASLYKVYEEKTNGHFKLWKFCLVGYLGSVGIGTLSDSLIPFCGENMLGVTMIDEHGLHLGFIEEWWLINPLAMLGILVAYLKPTTRLSHALHVSVSTGASLFHLLMALGGVSSFATYGLLFLILFVAVWIPCCTSDIVIPLIFIKNRKEINHVCH